MKFIVLIKPVHAKIPVYPPEHNGEAEDGLYEDSGLSDDDDDNDDDESSGDEHPATSGVTSSGESRISARSSSSEALRRSM